MTRIATLLAFGVFAASAAPVSADCLDLRQDLLGRLPSLLDGVKKPVRFDGEEKYYAPETRAYVIHAELDRLLKTSRAPNPNDKHAALDALSYAHAALAVGGQFEEALRRYEGGTPGAPLAFRAAEYNKRMATYADCVANLLPRIAGWP